MKITFQAPPKNLDEKMIFNILRDNKMLNCEVLVRDENGMFPPLCFCTWFSVADCGHFIFKQLLMTSLM